MLTTQLSGVCPIISKELTMIDIALMPRRYAMIALPLAQGANLPPRDSARKITLRV